MQSTRNLSTFKKGQLTGMFIPNEIGSGEGNGNNNRINLERTEKNNKYKFN